MYSTRLGQPGESDLERGLEIFDHREMTHVEGREIQAFHVRCGRYQVISEPYPLMRATVLAYELRGAPCPGSPFGCLAGQTVGILTGMGLKDRRTRHSMRDPVRGEFRVTGSYFAHPGSNSYRLMLTGVVTGPGLPPTAGEHLDDKSGRWFDDHVLPVTVDRSDPTQFVILWDEVAKPDHRADVRRQAAHAAEQMEFSGSAEAPLQATGSVSGGAPAPNWVREMLGSLPADVLPGASQAPQPIIVDAGTQVIDPTAGHLSAADAERLSALGEPATAVVTAVTDVPVPRATLPGPTASLCDLSLQVTRSDERTYSASTRLGFRSAQRRAAITAAGIVLPVRIDPADQARVAVDLEAFNAQYPES